MVEPMLRETCSISTAGWECSSEHGSFTLRLFFRGFILNDVPMLDEDSVFNAHNIRGDPIHRKTKIAKSTMHDHEISPSNEHSGLVLQRWRGSLHEIE